MELPKCQRPECPKSDTELLNETEEHLYVRCKTCRSYRILSRRRARAKAIHELRMERKEKLARRKSRPVIFV